MTIEDQVLALFSEANPVPDPGTLVIEPETIARLANTEQWSTDMEDAKLVDFEPPTPSNRRRWLIGAAAAVVLVAGVAAGLLLAAGDETTPVTAATTQPPTTTATTVAEALPSEPVAVIEYLYRVWLDDPRAAAAVFSDDAVINNAPVSPHRRDGIGPIRAFLAAEANILETIEITRIEVDGDTVSWDDQVLATDGRELQQVLATDGGELQQIGHVAVVQDGRIVTWDFGSFQVP